jgi:DNA (cytosine-5)-methyltransferase 1
VSAPLFIVADGMSSTEARRTAVPSQRGTVLRLRRADQAPDPGDLGAIRRWVASSPRPRAVDLFCGAGGLSLGLRDAGFSVLVGADSNPWVVETHTANIGGLGYVGDLSDPAELLEQLDGWGVDHVELVAGGVPCQPFSRAGQAKLRELIRSGERHPQDPRALLWRSFMRIVERLRPEAVLVENVPDLPAWDDGAVLSGFLQTLGDLGYTVDARIIDCFRFGVPQHRSRLLLTGLRGGRRMRWPAETDDFVTLRDAIGDLPPVPGGQRAERLPYRPRPGVRSAFQERMRRDLSEDMRPWIHDHMTRAVRTDDWEAYTGLEPGQTYADIPAHLQRYRTDIFTDKYKRLSWGELSRTITAHIAKDGYWYIHPEQHRTLSVREAARLQTFPDWFRFAGQPSHRLAQIGNAVPPLAAEAVGTALLDSMHGRERERADYAGARELLLEWNARQPAHPWRRRGTEPWLVLAAELSLERAGPVDQLRRFESLRRIAPSPPALVALAEPHRRLRAVGVSAHGARMLVTAAEAVVELFDGEVPSEDLELRAIPGVGDSLAKTVLCFGHGRAAVPLHTAAARVATRVAGSEHRRRWQLRLDLHRLAGPAGPDAAFNAAVLQLGTTVCLPTEPRCPECPLHTECATAGRRARRYADHGVQVA